MDAELQWILETTGARTIERGERIQSLWRGYGEIYRVRIDGRPAIVKSVRPPARPTGDASHARKVRSYDVELEWYRTYAQRCETSRVAEFIAGRSGLLVLEDLDAAGFAGRRRELAPCVAWLAKFHARFLGVAPTGLWETGTYWHLETRREELANIDEAAIREAAPILDRKGCGSRSERHLPGRARTRR